MEPRPAPSVERLIADLNRLRREAGSPALGELVRLSQHKMSKSTLHDHLAGRRTRVPPWRLVAAFVSACHTAAGNTGLDVERLGTIDEWHARWAAAADTKGESVEEAGEESSFEPPSKDPSAMHSAIKPVNQSETITDRKLAPAIRSIEEYVSRQAKSLLPYAGLLVVTSGPNAGTGFPIEHNITTIGRNPESDIWLNDPSVSRHHATIYRRDGSFFIRDSGSRNGSFLHGELIEKEVALSAFDELHLAAFSLMFLRGGANPKGVKKSYQPIQSRLVNDTSVSTENLTAFAQKTDEYQAPSRRSRWGRRRRGS